MNYHDITKDDMLNGVGLRVVLWVSGCTHKCDSCQNPITWDVDGGLEFDKNAEEELFEALGQTEIDGITFSGGDPLHPFNRDEVTRLAKKVKEQYQNKSVWLYSGFLWENVKDLEVMQYTDVFLDGRFQKELLDNNLHWVGSSNQRVIDVQKSLAENNVILYKD